MAAYSHEQGLGDGAIVAAGTAMSNEDLMKNGGARFALKEVGSPKPKRETRMHTHDSLNALLRGELAVTETYQQALAKVGDDPRGADLHIIRDAHRTAANTLRQHVHEHGGKPDQGSGGWGVYAKTVEAAARMFGDTAALKALKEGEEYGIKDYEKALADATLPTDCKELIRSTLLPQTRAHVPVLEKLMAAK
jgi:Domain of unknown function (DUF2383)